MNPMLSNVEYQYTWMIYYGAALCLWCLVGVALRKWPLWLFHSSLALIGGVLFPPWYITSDQAEMAPAFTIFLFDLLSGNSAQPLFRSFLPMAGTAIGLFGLFSLLSFLIKTPKKQQKI